MARSFPITVSLVFCWMFSPDALVLLGNNVGRGGIFFLLPLSVAAIVSALTISLVHHPSLAISTSSSFSNLATEIGTLPAMALTLASRVSLVLLLPTGMLVTAGFTFNEIFVYWFPNFAFSFLLLGFVLFLHLAGNHIALAMQPLFIGLTIFCLVLLSLAGLITSHDFAASPTQSGVEQSLPLTLFCGALLLFLGYDLQESSLFSSPRSYLIWSLLFGFILLALWAFVSIKHVPLTKLAHSTIPYITSARKILGQPGRIIMGIAIISGVCGVVNSLFLLTNRSIQQMAAHVFLPSITGPSWKQKISPVLFTLLIGILMAAGFAGSENLDVYIYGALLFWLLTTGLHCFTATRKLQKLQATSSLYNYLLSAVFPLAAGWLAYTHTQAVTLLLFCFLVLITSWAFSACGLWSCRKTLNKKKDQQGDAS